MSNPENAGPGMYVIIRRSSDPCVSIVVDGGQAKM